MIALGYGALGLALIAALRLGDRRATRFADVTGADDD